VPLLLLFVVLPLVELWLLLRVGAVLGAGVTLGLVIVTGVLGATLARRQGLAVFQRLQAELQQGRQPTATMLEGFAILLAGVVLMTPGLLTDALGLALLVPPSRRAILASLRRRFEASLRSGRTQVHTFVGGRPVSGADPLDIGGVGGPRPSERVKDVPFIDVTPPGDEDPAEPA
jgi:UPF0716 protein FxsA